MILLSPYHAAAEGSTDLHPAQPLFSGGARANLEWNNDTNRYGPPEFDLIRRTLLKVYVEAGEYLLMGSSAVDVPDLTGAIDKGDILVYGDLISNTIGAEILPAVPLFSCKQQRALTKNITQGRISSRSQEIAGADTIIDETLATPGLVAPDRYVPCFYKAGQTGIYNVVFYGPLGSAESSGNSAPSGSIDDTPNNFNAQQATTVAIWDVSVRSSLTATTTILGRLFTYYMTMYTGGNGRPIYDKIYIVTLDGFRYEIQLNGMDPNGFVLYGNQPGFLDTNGAPLYHDVMAATQANGVPLTFDQQNQLEKIQGNVNLAPPAYPIFLNPPDEKVLTELGIPLKPIIPEVTSFVFTGSQGSTTYVGEGGTFSFESTVNGVYDIVISRDGLNFDPASLDNRVLRGIIVTDSHASVHWDGLDNKAEAFPVGSDYVAQTSIHGGELHFPFLDVENSPQGSPMLHMVNPPNAQCAPLAGGCTGGFYDDRGYRTVAGTLVGTGVNQPLCPNNTGLPPDPLFSDLLQGFNTIPIPPATKNQRAFGFLSGGNPQTICASDGGFGDKKGLDLWTYYPSKIVSTPLRIIEKENPTAINLVSFTAKAQGEAVTLVWETAVEFDTWGFNLLRSSDDSRASAIRVTPQMILAQGRGQGAVYTWTDQGTQAEVRYHYWLQEVELNGSVNEYGPVVVARATPLASWRIFVPLLKR